LQLGLHTVKVSSLARTPRASGGGVHLRPNKSKLSKLLKKAGFADTEMWVSNFVTEHGFDLGQASVNEQQGTWSYNLEGGVFQVGFSSTPTLNEFRITSKCVSKSPSAPTK